METPSYATPEEVLYFLEAFRTLKREHGIVFFQRDKNTQALLDLEITAADRELILDQLSIRDYYKGPKPDGVRKGVLYWEFGKKVNRTEVYIKLSLGIPGGPVGCYSFHPAERRIKYPIPRA